VALDDQLCFALYSASRAVIAHYRPMLDQMGITYPQFLVLMVLWEHDDLAVKEICDRLALDSGTISPLLKRLEAAGLVTRRRSTEDERQVHVTITEAGRALHAPGCAVSEMMIGTLQMSTDQFAVLKGQLTAITDRVTRRD